jgi:protein-S-isoprenylcysteine O-methyltransferase Ste14
MMAVLSLGLLTIFGVLCVGVRTWVHVRRTGDSPFRSGPFGNGYAAVVAFASGFVIAAVADLAGIVSPLWSGPVWAVVGSAIASAGIAFTMWSQLGMGESWRIGIDPEERTALVTGGVYRYVRNPIYTGMFAVALGATIVLPNVVAIVAFVAVVATMEFVVRTVEEPYLASVHNEAFRDWGAHAGRFVPWFGHLRRTGS